MHRSNLVTIRSKNKEESREWDGRKGARAGSGRTRTKERAAYCRLCSSKRHWVSSKGETYGRALLQETVACSPFPSVKSWALPKIIAKSAIRADLETESAMPLLLNKRGEPTASYR